MFARNRMRAERTKRSLFRGGYLPSGEVVSTAVCDVLADLRHLCDAYDLDFATIDKQAYLHYSTETAGGE